MSFKEWFRAWDQDKFDLTYETARPAEKKREDVPEEPVSVEVDEKKENRIWKSFGSVYSVCSVLLLLVMCLFLGYSALRLPPFGKAENPVHNEVTERYITSGTEETGAVNVVAGVILDYRAFDTLGESHVLYTALTAVLILLLSVGAGSGAESAAEEAILRAEDAAADDPLLRMTAKILVPPLVLFGLYIMLNGHLGPGGGFSGGAVIGAGLILYARSFGFTGLEKVLNMKSFRVVTLLSLGFYSLAKCYSFFCGANHLESGIRPGTPGLIFSAGLILPLNVAVGLVVACTMYGIYSLFKRGRI